MHVESENHPHTPLTLHVCIDIGDRAEAIDWYSKGIAELGRGIAMTVHTSGESYLAAEVCVSCSKSPPHYPGQEEQRKVEELRDRMLRNMEMSRERVSVLCKLTWSD